MLRVTRVHSDIRGLPLLIDRIHARASRFQTTKDKLFSSHGLMAVISLILILFSVTGCVVRPADPTDFEATKPAYVEATASPWTGFKYKSTKDVAGEGEYHPDTKAFKFKLSSNASEVNKTLAPILDAITQLQQKQNEGLDRVVQQQQIIGQTISNIGMNIAQIATSLTNLPGTIISALTGKAFTPNAPPIPTAPLASLTIEEVRAVVAAELNSRPPALTEDQIADVVRQVLNEHDWSHAPGG